MVGTSNQSDPGMAIEYSMWCGSRSMARSCSFNGARSHLCMFHVDFLEFAQASKTLLTRTSQAFDGLFHDDFLEIPQGSKTVLSRRWQVESLSPCYSPRP